MDRSIAGGRRSRWGIQINFAAVAICSGSASQLAGTLARPGAYLAKDVIARRYCAVRKGTDRWSTNADVIGPGATRRFTQLRGGDGPSHTTPEAIVTSPRDRHNP
jgi:hypothetical protein